MTWNVSGSWIKFTKTIEPLSLVSKTSMWDYWGDENVEMQNLHGHWRERKIDHAKIEFLDQAF